VKENFESMMRSTAWFISGCILPLAAQTQVDLRTQARGVDFGSATSTRPLKTGGALPATCTQGDLYFLTVAAAGANLYGCVSANTWSPQPGSGSSPGVVQIQNTGTAVGARPILDLATGPGISNAVSDTGQSISIQTSIDTSVVETNVNEQSGASLLCSSPIGSGTTYTCAMSPTLTAYTAGMYLHWNPGATGTGGPTTLNVDALGPIFVKLADGVTDVGPGDLAGGRALEIWYDGAAFRLLNSPIPAGILGDTRPSCAVAVRGRLWFVAGAAGTKDSLSVCAKDATDAYAWRTLY
jgi:hypothetical protein